MPRRWIFRPPTPRRVDGSGIKSRHAERHSANLKFIAATPKRRLPVPGKRIPLKASHWMQLLAPPRCAGCGGATSSAVLCAACWAELPWLSASEIDRSGPGALDRCVATLSLGGEAREWIHRFKYPASNPAFLDSPALAVARELALSTAARVDGMLPDRIIPIPLHPKRLRGRGFNPASLLAAEIARSLRIPLDPRCLMRVRDTPPQAGLDARGRRENVAGAFRLRKRGMDLRSQRFWLVDDVVTTGATLAEAAAELSAAGAANIVAVCLARTPGRREFHP